MHETFRILPRILGFVATGADFLHGPVLSPPFRIQCLLDQAACRGPLHIGQGIRRKTGWIGKGVNDAAKTGHLGRSTHMFPPNQIEKRQRSGPESGTRHERVLMCGPRRQPPPGGNLRSRGALSGAVPTGAANRRSVLVTARRHIRAKNRTDSAQMAVSSQTPI